MEVPPRDERELMLPLRPELEPSREPLRLLPLLLLREVCPRLPDFEADFPRRLLPAPDDDDMPDCAEDPPL